MIQLNQISGTTSITITVHTHILITINGFLITVLRPQCKTQSMQPYNDKHSTEPTSQTFSPHLSLQMKAIYP